MRLVSFLLPLEVEQQKNIVFVFIFLCSVSFYFLCFFMPHFLSLTLFYSLSSTSIKPKPKRTLPMYSAFTVDYNLLWKNLPSPMVKNRIWLHSMEPYQSILEEALITSLLVYLSKKIIPIHRQCVMFGQRPRWQLKPLNMLIMRVKSIYPIYLIGKLIQVIFLEPSK